MKHGEYAVIDATEMDWTEATVEHTGGIFQVKRLFRDPDTGMGVTLLHYPAGFTNPLHTHQCGHGMYVLEGTLKTHRGVYGPGSFVWFPEGEAMEHGDCHPSLRLCREYSWCANRPLSRPQARGTCIDC